jgi:hypothetical protein
MDNILVHMIYHSHSFVIIFFKFVFNCRNIFLFKIVYKIRHKFDE